MEDYCPFCVSKGKYNKRIPFMINFEEAVVLCDDNECNNLQNGKFELISLSRSADSKSKKPQKSETGLVSSSSLDIELDELLSGLQCGRDSANLDSNDLDILGLNNSVSENPFEAFRGGNVIDEGFKYPLWKNEDNLCWLHSLMCVIVHNNSIRNCVLGKIGDTPLKKLISGYDECVALLNSESAEISFISEMLKLLRNELFQQMKPLMGIQLGECENPWFALWTLSKIYIDICYLFDYNYNWQIHCQLCGFTKRENKRKILLTFPTILDHLSLPANAFTTFPCSHCSNSTLKRVLKFETYPRVLALQFENGLAGANISDYDFDVEGALYKVSSFIQYTRHPNHFLTWIRDFATEKWLCCDDLEPSASSFKKQILDVKCSEIHILFWEKIEPVALGNNSNTLECDKSFSSIVNRLDDGDSIYNNRVNEDANVTGDNCKDVNVSLFSDYSNSSLSETASRATSFNDISNYEFKTSQSTLSSYNSKNLMKNINNDRGIVQLRKNTDKSQPRKCKTPESIASSTASEVSNASDGDISIASSTNGSGRWSAYKAHSSRPSKLCQKALKSSQKPALIFPKLAKSSKSRLTKALRKVKNTNSDKSLIVSINSLLDQTSVFLNKNLNS